MRNLYVSFGFPRIVYIVVSSYAPGGTRTPNPLSRNQLRYPITPQEQVHQARVELATFRVSDECSNQLSYWCIWEWMDSNQLSRMATVLQTGVALQLYSTPLFYFTIVSFNFNLCVSPSGYAWPKCYIVCVKFKVTECVLQLTKCIFTGLIRVWSHYPIVSNVIHKSSYVNSWGRT